jgi:hypothetical protein
MMKRLRKIVRTMERSPERSSLGLGLLIGLRAGAMAFVTTERQVSVELFAVAAQVFPVSPDPILPWRQTLRVGFARMMALPQIGGKLGRSSPERPCRRRWRSPWAARRGDRFAGPRPKDYGSLRSRTDEREIAKPAQPGHASVDISLTKSTKSLQCGPRHSTP